VYSEVELRHLRCAIAVADELHFTRAAQKLHITQSALTRQIRQLELQLGVDLFIRDTRRVELTAAGKALTDEGRKALEILEDGIRRAVGAGRGEVDVLRVAYSPFVDIHFFTQLKKFLVEIQPELKVDYVSEAAPELEEGLIDGTYQAGIGPLPIDNNALAGVCLFQEPMFVVFPKAHRLGRKRRVYVSDLGDDPVIWMPPKVRPSFYNDFVEWCRKQGYSPNLKQYVTSVSEILGFVAEGVGIGFVKASDSKLGSDLLAFCPLGNRPYLVETGIMYRADNRSEILRRMVVRLTERFPCSTAGAAPPLVPSASGAQRPGSE
jgi:DNA-binding transcriptional LysR family regulator